MKLKAGIIVGLISGALGILLWIIAAKTAILPSGAIMPPFNIVQIVAIYTTLPLIFVTEKLGLTFQYITVWKYLLIVVYYFLIGMVVGLIVGKIKSKKVSSENL